MEAPVPGAIDLSHPARAEEADDLVDTELGAGREAHVRNGLA